MTGAPLRVLVAGTGPPTVGGIATAIEDQAAGLVALGHRVSRVNTGEARRPAPNRLRVDNAVAALRDAARVRRAVRSTRPDVVAVHTAGSPVLPALRSLAIVVAARLAGAPVVVHVHAYDLEAVAASGSGAFRRALRAVVGSARSIVVLHDGVADDVRRLAPGAEVVVVPNCVSIPTAVPGRSGTGAVRAVFVGTVGRRKGVIDLLDALRSMHPPLPCDVVGGPAEETEDAHRAVLDAAADLVAAGTVRLHGELDRAAGRAVLAGAEIFVLPSHAEGMPMALLEAMAAGLPAVVSDAGAMGELVSTAGCGLVVPVGDVGALAAALGRLRDDAGERAEMGDAGRRAVEERYAPDVVVRRLVEVYRSAVR